MRITPKFSICVLFICFAVSSLILWSCFNSVVIKDCNCSSKEEGQKHLKQDAGGVTTRPLISCETVHLAFVVAGSSTARNVAVVLKSLMFYRHSPLHFHFISDKVAKYSLKTLLQTWRLPQVNYTFYSTNAVMHAVEWIPNAHYSGVFGLMKLTLPYVLKEIDKVIVMDTDLTIVSDVRNLWKVFADVVKDRKLLGLVENQSDWYLGTIWKDHNPWPAIGRGFNTGVILMNLEEMRKNNWSEMWRNIANSTLSHSQKYTSLADQDIINAVIKWQSGIVYRLPCSWNVQLGDHSRSIYCYMNTTADYHIIHWNSPKKLETSFKNAAFFRQLHYAFMQYDGTHLTHSLIYCSSLSATSTVIDHISDYASGSNICINNLNKNLKPFRTHPYFYGIPRTSTDPFDVTLVSQLSMDRLQTLDIILKHWAGPISLSLYATDTDSWTFLDYLNDMKIESKEWSLSVHVVYKDNDRLYPVNYLRNVALTNSNTPFVFLSDIDFVPMFNLYSYLKQAIRILQPGARKRALVVPAFESLQYKFSYPMDKHTLMSQVKNGQVETFRQNIWKQGHQATNYDKWYKASHPYKIQWSPNYEPYIAVAKNVSKYDERFTGFGWNKVSHTIQLDAEGYEFVVLPDAFTIHLPHSPSVDILHYRTNKNYRECQKQLKKKFISELIETYGTKANKYI